MTGGPDREAIEDAACAIRAAGGLLVTAGAGMGVDSGLPDFRGNEGFWRAYPPFARLGLSFVELANPRWFHEDPGLAWGFYGHRLELYRRTVPHEGFSMLRRWMERAPGGGFVFTSNVDGQFQAAGFPGSRIVECHGSIHMLQCLRGCGMGLFSADGMTVRVDDRTMRAVEPLPACPRCGGLTRPNILMFGDWGWDDTRTDAQEVRFAAWLETVAGDLVIVECGAGMAVPTVRLQGERVAAARRGTLVRINVREPHIALPRHAPARPRGIPVASGALDAVRAIDTVLSGQG